MKFSKQLLVKMPWIEHWRLRVCIYSDVGKMRLWYWQRSDRLTTSYTD